MPCGRWRSVQGFGWGGGCGAGGEGRGSAPLEPCHRPSPHPPGGQQAGGPFVAFAQSACPAGSGGWAPLGTGCRTRSQLWPEGTRRAPDEGSQPGHTHPAPKPAPEDHAGTPGQPGVAGGGLTLLWCCSWGPANASSTRVRGLRVEGMPPEGTLLMSSGPQSLLVWTTALYLPHL